MSGKKIKFRYDSEAATEKIKCTFWDNLAITNEGKTEVVNPSINILGYASNDIAFVAAKECLEEMLALMNAAANAE